MDEAAECDLLLLMREGGLVAVDDARRAARADRRPTTSGEAFLRLIEPRRSAR